MSSFGGKLGIALGTPRKDDIPSRLVAWILLSESRIRTDQEIRDFMFYMVSRVIFSPVQFAILIYLHSSSFLLFSYFLLLLLPTPSSLLPTPFSRLSLSQ